MKLPLAILLLAVFALHARAEDASVAANAVNSLGIDLLKHTGKPSENIVFSPYSIQVSLAIAYAGADGKTRAEMARALHFPKDDATLAVSLAALRKAIGHVADDYSFNEDREPFTLITVNRLYAQDGYEFEKGFLSFIDEHYGTVPIKVDFKGNPDDATIAINTRVAADSHQRIVDLIPPGALNERSRLVLVNGVYLKAAWESPFAADKTKPAPFYVKGTRRVNVATMHQAEFYGYAKKKGYTVVGLDYTGEGFQFVVILPDERNGLPALEARLTPAMLADCTHLDCKTLVKLWLPRCLLAPPAVPLEDALGQLGMITAFSEKPGVADFGRMVRPTDEFLPHISTMLHKTWLELDEVGTVAIAETTSSYMAPFGSIGKPTPLPEVSIHVDHPFLFLIQQRDTGACLFIGRVTSPVIQEVLNQVTFPEFFKYSHPHKSSPPLDFSD